MYKLEYYSDKNVPPQAFGFQNTGSICYFNSLMQSLISCSSFNQIVLNNEEFLQKTVVGSKLYYFIDNIMKLQPLDNKRDIMTISRLTPDLISTLITEVNKSTKDNYSFGRGQESASEALILLLNLTDVEGYVNPISNIFNITIKSKIWDLDKREVICTNEDKNIQMDLFYLKNIKNMPTDIDSFSKLIQHRHYPIDDFQDESGSLINGIKEDILIAAHDVIICTFNQYDKKTKYYYPEIIEFPDKDITNNKIQYKLVAKINHYGTLFGGHYTADCYRGDNNLYNFNDMSSHKLAIQNIIPAESSYILFYHIIK